MKKAHQKSLKKSGWLRFTVGDVQALIKKASSKNRFKHTVRALPRFKTEKLENDV